MVAKVTLPYPAALPKSENPTDKAIRLAMGSLDTAESYIHGAWMAARSLDGDELPAGEALQAIISSAGDALGEVRGALRQAGAQLGSESVTDPLISAIDAYNVGMAAYDGREEFETPEAEQAAIASTYGPPSEILENWDRPAVTRSGAIAALQFAAKGHGIVGIDTQQNMIEAALGYFAREGGAA